MAPQQKKGDVRDLATGAILQVMEAATLGMPFEVWKTQQGAHIEENVVQSFKAIWAKGGPGAFWKGSRAKMMEAASKGAVLLYAKELTLDLCESLGMERESGLVGSIAGFSGGVAQTTVMTPLTYVVTYYLKNPNSQFSTLQVLQQAGLRGCYGSFFPIALRQGSNWALRQGINDAIVAQYKHRVSKTGKITDSERVLLGLLAGCLSCINQPFEIMRIQIQSAQSQGQKLKFFDCVRLIHGKYGFLGFYAGLIPRMGLAAWQTLFMVTFPPMVKEQIRKWDAQKKH